MALEASRQEGLIGAEAPPRYRQIAGTLAAEIARGLHEPGAALPSEHQLCRLFSVSRVTVRAALQQLVEDGLIERLRADPAVAGLAPDMEAAVAAGRLTPTAAAFEVLARFRG